MAAQQESPAIPHGQDTRCSGRSSALSLPQVLALESEHYGRSVSAAGRGSGGDDARGADLPSRLAAQQMGALAGMSLKASAGSAAA